MAPSRFDYDSQLFIKHKCAPKRTLACRILYWIADKFKKDINDLHGSEAMNALYKTGRPGRNEKREWMAQGSGWAWNALSSGSFLFLPPTSTTLQDFKMTSGEPIVKAEYITLWCVSWAEEARRMLSQNLMLGQGKYYLEFSRFFKVYR